ncbi:MAG TPA: hypothetical protein DEF47_07425 [Herpetosiphon sp.]|uniref:Uncharacterized protein n=1 Tax=Herpetosiphon aurantiacus (strain ATCC 23779 / DSM 785 / 114-95) TaxID=316274 RepID=A9B5J3_HERA2|nr:DUF5946 family protein [Herpetosiphon sp.]ABX02818.1 conserved hypothetical protein [Herpetosiphon aurantiacus DSM 785]HBW49720.1 hypothetical protein [Herpetosiphon sp.]
MPTTEFCLECGAPLVEGFNCWEQLGALIAWEYNDPALHAQHFLIVASYNLQHPAQFTDMAIEQLRSAFNDYLDHGVSAATLRQRAAKTYAGATRVLRPEAERRPQLQQWAMTIADVYLPEQPAGAVERLLRWASVIQANQAVAQA